MPGIYSSYKRHGRWPVLRVRFGRGAGFSRFLLLAPGEGESQTAEGPCSKRSISVQVCGGRKDAMAEMSNSDLEKVLKNVINVLEDGQKGYADLGEHLKDDTLKRYFLAESLKRANFRGELENELHRHGVKDVHEEGTTAGAIHRTWGDLKAKVFGTSDHDLLGTAEQGEDTAKKTYKEALEKELPAPLRQLLEEQNRHIVSSHDYVRNHRDATASK